MLKYKHTLLNVINEWKTNISDEWLFSNYRGTLYGLNNEEAFNFINDIVDILLNEKDESTLIELILVIYTLANISNTTEIPVNLKNNYTIIKDKINNYGGYINVKLKELYAYYRI